LAQYDINLREYWRILRKRKFIVFFTAVLLGAFSTFFAIVQAPTPLYTSGCSIKFEKETSLEGLYARTLSWSGADDIETQISIITGYSVILEVAKEMGMVPRGISEEARSKANIINIVEHLQSKVNVVRENYTNILDIRITDPDPSFAQRMANTVATVYKRWHAEQQGKRTQDALKYINDQLRKMRQNLQQTEEEFNSFAQENQLISIDMQSENLLLRTKDIRDKIRKLDEDKSEFEALFDRVRDFVKDPSVSDGNFYSTKASRQYQSTNDSLVELLLKRGTLLENYTTQHPEVIAIGQKISENTRKMAMLLKLQIDNIQKRKIDLNKELDRVDNKTNLLMEKKLEFDRLKREVESFRDMTALLEQKNQEASIRKAEKPEEVVVVKFALLSTTEINPPKTTTTGAMGVIIGIVLGLVLAFIVETFDTSLGAIEDVEETLGAKVLGVIPHTDAKDMQASLRESYPEGMDEHTIKRTVNLVTHFAPKTMISESFRALRTNIQIREGEDKLKTIAVASTSPQEGKTLISSNLAISLAQTGRKILLVGADLRKPMLAKSFGLETTPGLTDIVLGNYPWTDTVKSITDIIMGRMTMDEVMVTPGMDNLHIITSGTIPPNPAELIESGRFMNFIKEAEKEYDIIIFDSTPILSTADAAILGKKVDGVLIVYRVGAVSKGLLKRSATQLEQANCNIIGVVLNGMKPDISPDFQDFKYYRYYASYESEEIEKRGRRIFSFLRRGGDHDSAKIGTLPASAERATPDGRRRPGRFLRLSLIVLALIFLAVGILWQNGVIDPEEILKLSGMGKKESVRPTAVKKPLSATPDKPPERAPLEEKTDTDTEPEKTTVTEMEARSPVPDIEKSAPDAVEPVSDVKEPAPDIDKQDVNEIKGEKLQYEYAPGSYPFSLYLGSFQTLKRAEKAAEVFSREGLSPFWVKINFKEKGIWYRVYLGHYKGHEQALNSLKEHKLKNAEIRKTAYTNLIGTYSSPDDLDAMVQALEDRGYSPYVIEDQVGRAQLFAGAFITEKGAEDHRDMLKSDRIESQVVRR